MASDSAPDNADPLFAATVRQEYGRLRVLIRRYRNVRNDSDVEDTIQETFAIFLARLRLSLRPGVPATQPGGLSPSVSEAPVTGLDSLTATDAAATEPRESVDSLVIRNPRAWLVGTALKVWDKRRPREMPALSGNSGERRSERPISIEDSLAVCRAMARLDDAQRELLWLYFCDDLTRCEISELKDLPEGTVASRIRKALDALRVAYDEDAGPQNGKVSK